MVRVRSQYWRAFSVTGKVAQCKLCERKLSIANKSTNSLIRHLRAKHRIYSIEKHLNTFSGTDSSAPQEADDIVETSSREQIFKEEPMVVIPSMSIENNQEPNVPECSQEIDELKHFFDAMQITVRKFPPVTIARIKLQISQIIGQEEINWAENENKSKCNYLDITY